LPGVLSGWPNSHTIAGKMHAYPWLLAGMQDLLNPPLLRPQAGLNGTLGDTVTTGKWMQEQKCTRG